MLLKIAKSSVILGLAISSLSASAFNEQAEKDRKALVKYFETKFENPEANKDKFFPYSTDEETKNVLDKGVKHNTFALGSYAFNKASRAQYEVFKDGFLPYEESIEKGEKLYKKPFANGKSIATCLPDPVIGHLYPKFDETKKEVISLTSAINDCLRSNGEKEWKTKDGDMAKVEAFIAFKTAEAGKEIDIKIDSKEAQDAYERGKKYYYSQRGYINVSCASCHVQGAGQRVRNEYMSPLLGSTTHFPVYRLVWADLGTLEKRMSGCITDQGQKPPKDESKEMKELLYFMAYMSNGMKIDGPDLRK